MMCFQICGSFKSAKIRKVRKPKKKKIRKFADLRFADLICGTPTFEQIADAATTGSFFSKEIF